MNKIKVMPVFGTRPEAIKMLPLVLELKSRSEFECITCVTAQHREMLDQALEIFGVAPDVDLDIMRESQTLTQIATRVLSGMEKVLAETRPDIVLVHGDTSTALHSALASFYQKIPVGHVEAGLRTYDKYSPYPEEINRRLIAPLADFHFSPTAQNRENLLREGIDKNIFITGNTALDAVRLLARPDYEFKTPELKDAVSRGKRIIMMTAHRRENYGEPFKNIFSAVNDIAAAFPDVLFVYPVHLSPVVRGAAEILAKTPGVMLIDPIPVDESLNLMARSYMVMTDSGGIQEEAPSLGKPVLVLRTETERPEAVAAGTVKIAGVRREDIFKLASELLSNPEEYQRMARAVNPYGDGYASRKICDALAASFA